MALSSAQRDTAIVGNESELQDYSSHSPNPYNPKKFKLVI